MFESPVPGLERRRYRIFICCFLQYTFIHSCRSTWSYTSGELKNQKHGEIMEGFDSTYLGYVNFAFLFVYGSSMLFLGQLGDKIGPKLFILQGTFVTSAIVFLIAFLYPQESKHIWIFMVLMIFNGIAQASVWPGLMAILNNWFSKTHKVILMGYFTACTNVGNMLGDLFAAVLLEWLNFHVMSPIYLSAACLLAISIVNVFLLEDSSKPYIYQFRNSRTGSLIYKPSRTQSEAIIPPDPKEVGYLSLPNYEGAPQQPNEESGLQDAIIEYKAKQELKKDSINMITAWTLPNVAIYAFAFGCIKAVFYILAFWLPSYLEDNDVENVALVTSMIEIGTIPGGILICYAGEYYHKRASIIVPALWLGTLVMVTINYFHHMYMVTVFLTGLLIGGCYNNVSGAIVIELSNMKELKGNKKSTATVTSVIMGWGAVFAAVNQLIVHYVEKILFLYCGLMAIIAGLLLVPLIIGEVRRTREQKLLVADTMSLQIETNPK